jgi:hypothetical protein
MACHYSLLLTLIIIGHYYACKLSGKHISQTIYFFAHLSNQQGPPHARKESLPGTSPIKTSTYCQENLATLFESCISFQNFSKFCIEKKIFKAHFPFPFDVSVR